MTARRRSGATHEAWSTSPSTWKILRELEKKPTSEPRRHRNRINSVLGRTANVLLPMSHESIGFRSIRVADFTPASIAVKGVRGCPWERLSMFVGK
jgi:hypothetical protein